MAGTLISLDAMRAGNANIVAKVLNDEYCRDRVESILGSARDDVRSILTERGYLVEALRDALLEHEELIGPDISGVLERAQASWEARVVDLREESPDQAPAVNPGPPASG
jgi:cell division protease FtsH